MGMPVHIEIVDPNRNQKEKKEAIEKVFSYCTYVDLKFSTYKKESEISKFNRGEITRNDFSQDMKTVFELSEKTKKETDGYFNIKKPDGSYDPSGLVKGWAIYHSAKLLEDMGFKNFYVDIGGDIQTKGHNEQGHPWIIGIKNPFKQKEIVKTVHLSGEGIATSGTYIRGDHIYNPKVEKEGGHTMNDIISLTVIASNVYEADRFATAAYAMGKNSIYFLEKTKGLEGYLIDKKGIATMTSGFMKFVQN
jgi:thiamine biosynthesis lipoprotein